MVSLIDKILFVFYMVVAVLAPFDAGLLCLPSKLHHHYFPIDLKHWLTRKYGDYLVVEKPGFFVALVWLELLFQWPLSIVNLYGIVGRRSWVSTTCLVHGVSFFTAMLAVSVELMESSHKVPDKLLMAYFLFIGFGVLAIVRGLLPLSGKNATIGTRAALAGKKKA